MQDNEKIKPLSVAATPTHLEKIANGMRNQKRRHYYRHGKTALIKNF